jgi:hypothetical protein
MGLRSVFFIPCTLARTWGTRPGKNRLPRPLILLRNSSDAGRFLLIGSLPGQAFGDLFEVPPEVSVQRFLGRDRGHFSYLRFSGIVEVGGAQVALQIRTAILLVAFTDSIPRKNQRMCPWRIAAC